jgi:hypothetical protein
MRGNVRLQNNMTADLVNYPVVPVFAEMLDQGAPRKIPRQFYASGQGEALVTHQVEAHALRLRVRLIKRVALDHLVRRLAQFWPCVASRHDRLGQAFRDKPAIRFLRHLKNQIIHARESMLSTHDALVDKTSVLFALVMVVCALSVARPNN